MEVVGCCMFFSGLFSMFVFDILQIYDGSIEICIGCSTITCTSLATGLVAIIHSLNKNCNTTSEKHIFSHKIQYRVIHKSLRDF